jgi:hypothetical protein
MDGFLQKDNREGEGGWNMRAVIKYLEAHDDLLKMIMLLFHLGGGRASRITQVADH